MAERVRALTGDGEELVRLMVAVLRGEPVGGKKPRVQDMLEAARWLGDRGWGRAVQSLDGADGERPVRVNLIWEDVGINDDGE